MFTPSHTASDQWGLDRVPVPFRGELIKAPWQNGNEQGKRSGEGSHGCSEEGTPRCFSVDQAPGGPSAVLWEEKPAAARGSVAEGLPHGRLRAAPAACPGTRRSSLELNCVLTPYSSCSLFPTTDPDLIRKTLQNIRNGTFSVSFFFSSLLTSYSRMNLIS